MSAAKFTPGYWQINHRDKLQVCDSDGVDRGCSPIAHCVGDGAAANAQFIAAAPELLHALYTALPYVEDALQDPAYKPASVRAALKLIHAALKQAGSK